MAGNVDTKELKAFADKLERAYLGGAGSSKERLMQSCAKEIATRLLRRVMRETPVVSGNLRRSWTTDASAKKIGLNYVIVVKNPTKYAIYVEYGHRTRGKRGMPGAGWVNGQFMLKISVEAVERMTPALLEKRLEAWLREVFA